MLRSIIIAFSMYSKIPMPKVEWDERSMRYAMCFFPAVGAILGAAAVVLSLLLKYLGVGEMLFASIMTVFPIVFTGGIHMDGFIDTSDALASYAEREKRLEILKDPHVGAFAVIKAAVYFMLMFGIWSEAATDDILIVSLGYILSRALSGLSVVTFPLAKSTGLAAMFSDAADKKRTAAALICWAVAAAAAAVFADRKRGFAMIIAAAAVFLIYRQMSIKRFGGITGDLAGWFLQLCEAVILAFVIISGRLI